MELRHIRVGFVISVTLFTAANIYTYARMRAFSSIDDGFAYFGWPFNIYAYGGYFGHPVYVWTGMLANLVIVVIVGLVIALLLARLTRRSMGAAEQIAGRERR
ncbi:MAG TPA: hypothetical protein VK557_20865 [Pyrinomonadaceae bacterium]|nr:hypothetical protein [Pyrinomonadaceae bacterium]